MNYFNISNLLSLCRAPLAFLFFVKIRWLRIVLVILAGLTDYFDGFLARRLRKTSSLGAVLDPVMDKFFVFVVIGILLFEHGLGPWAAVAMLSRDLFLGLFLAFLAITGTWRGLQAHAIWWGKVTTVAQYLVLGLIVVGVAIPVWSFWLFPLLGLLYFSELVLYYRQAQ